jgi:hypothetical protein
MKTADTPNLYLVVRPRQNPDQTFRNIWLDDDRLQSIETTIEIGEHCKEAMTTDKRVYVHRCGFETSAPCISCSALVVESSQITQSLYFVKFANHSLIGAVPSFSPSQGTNHYFA